MRFSRQKVPKIHPEFHCLLAGKNKKKTEILSPVCRPQRADRVSLCRNLWGWKSDRSGRWGLNLNCPWKLYIIPTVFGLFFMSFLFWIPPVLHCNRFDIRHSLVNFIDTSNKLMISFYTKWSNCAALETSTQKQFEWPRDNPRQFDVIQGVRSKGLDFFRKFVAKPELLF